jgi:hypothetical protein
LAFGSAVTFKDFLKITQVFTVIVLEQLQQFFETLPVLSWIFFGIDAIAFGNGSLDVSV